MTRGMRKLVGGIVVLLFALVLLDYISGADFIRATLALLGTA